MKSKIGKTIFGSYIEKGALLLHNINNNNNKAFTSRGDKSQTLKSSSFIKELRFLRVFNTH